MVGPLRLRNQQLPDSERLRQPYNHDRKANANSSAMRIHSRQQERPSGRSSSKKHNNSRRNANLSTFDKSGVALPQCVWPRESPIGDIRREVEFSQADWKKRRGVVKVGLKKRAIQVEELSESGDADADRST